MNKFDKIDKLAPWVNLGRFHELYPKKTRQYKFCLITDAELERRLTLVNLQDYPSVVQAYLRQVLGLPDLDLYMLTMHPNMWWAWEAIIEHSSFPDITPTPVLSMSPNYIYIEEDGSIREDAA